MFPIASDWRNFEAWQIDGAVWFRTRFELPADWLRKDLTLELGPIGIRVNAILPGFFPAEQNRKLLTPDAVVTVEREYLRFGLAGDTSMAESRTNGSEEMRTSYR